MKNTRTRLQHVIADDTGAHAIEMAIIAPVLFLLIMSTFEFGLITYTSSLLDTVTNQAARYAKTGFDYGNGDPTTFNPYGNEPFDPTRMEEYFTVNPDGTVTMKSREAFIRNYIHTAGKPFLNAESIRVETQIMTEFNNTGVTGSIAAPYDFGGKSQAVLYKISYEWSILTPLMMFLGKNGTYDIISTTLVKNEEFS